MKINILRVAHLANLPLSNEEIKLLEPQLNETLAYIDQLNEVDTKDITPTSHVTGLENITRKDTVRESLSQQQALANAPLIHEGYFQVKGLLDDE